LLLIFNHFASSIRFLRGIETVAREREAAAPVSRSEVLAKTIVTRMGDDRCSGGEPAYGPGELEPSPPQPQEIRPDPLCLQDPVSPENSPHGTVAPNGRTAGGSEAVHP
jgi:hypothetical protein